MAIYPKSGAVAQSNPSIEAWTEQVTSSLATVSLSPAVRGTTTSFGIPLDERHGPKQAGETDGSAPYQPHREPFRRDSLKRREALLRGKEGSRRRQRWENDRLLNNPWAQPPLPSDWEVHPTYPRHVVPYYLAPLWDANLAARQTAEKQKRETAKKRPDSANANKPATIPKDLLQTLKKAKAAKGLLQTLEEEVRRFVTRWAERTSTIDAEFPRAVDSEDDEEIVFIGRSGRMHDMPPSPKAKVTRDEDVQMNQMVFDGLVDDRGASFGRWLVHSIATYYNLRTWSITVGDPARREAYVGIKEVARSGRPVEPMGGLPRPLWGLV